MYKLICLSLFLGLSAYCQATRVFSAFKTTPPLKERRRSSVYIGQINLDLDAECSLQPILYATLDSIWDTRLIIGPRQGISVILPLPRNPDIFGQDINAHGQFTLNPLETGVGVLVSGPDWHGYRVSALIAGDFLGGQEFSIGSFRLLFAFAKVDFPTSSFFFGQLWSPLLIPDCFPQTVSFGTGIPFEVRSRCPQLRYVQHIGSYDVIIVAASQGPFISPGPIGPSFTYFANAVMPEWYVGVRKHFGPHQIGVGADFKRLVPRLVSEKNVKVNEIIKSAIVQTWATFNFDSSSVRMKLLYAQNAADHIVIGGYAVRTIDPITDARTYSTLASINYWIDASYVLPSQTSEIGLFVGLGKNLGSSDRLVVDSTGQPIVYPSLPVIADVDFAWRVAPRFVWTHDPLRFGLELDVTGASFGTLDCFARPKNPCWVTNYRILASFYYIF